MPYEHEPTSESLMARYQERLDAEAFGEIVSRFLTPALAVAREILSDAVLAEDAVQEAFLRIVRRRRQYDPSRPFSSWFYTILRNVCTDMLRHRARQTKMIQLAAYGREDSEQPSLDSLDTMDLLRKLPRESRTVLTLRIVHDLPFRDVAAALGISEEAAKKRAQRALRALREEQTEDLATSSLASG